MAALRQSWINVSLDWEFRDQSLTPPASWFVGLMLVMPTQSTAGTEATTGAGYTGYARQEIVSGLTTWSGTQSDGSTTASSGTRAYISNNNPVSFSASLAAAWAGIVGVAFFDAVTAGNMRRFGAIVDGDGNPITISREIGQSFILPAASLRVYRR
jgi:hypothetical protein